MRTFREKLFIEIFPGRTEVPKTLFFAKDDSHAEDIVMVLRDDGMSYGDYVEQLTYLLFLKMADERSRPPFRQPNPIPANCAWPTLTAKDGDELFDHYRHLLEKLGAENPPFGKKSSTMIVGENGRVSTEKDLVERDDFWATTSNKQLNFVQHVKTLLKPHGRCAIVVPDNVLFEGGAGETIRRKLLHECDVHPLLRLPTGLFYAQGVKANVLFFDRKPAGEAPWTKRLWIYDLHTNKHFTLKTNPLRREDLDEFVACYRPDNRHDRKSTGSPANPDGRFRAYDYEELASRDKASLDIFWLKDESLADSDNLPPPDVIAQEIVQDLEAALEQFRLIAGDLGAQNGEAG